MERILEKVPLREKIGYSLGDAAANLVFQMMMIYQLKFYTDVFGLEGAIAGTVLLVARIIDAFVDPAAGILSDQDQYEMGKVPSLGNLDSLAFYGILCIGILQSRYRG